VLLSRAQWAARATHLTKRAGLRGPTASPKQGPRIPDTMRRVAPFVNDDHGQRHAPGEWATMGVLERTGNAPRLGPGDLALLGRARSVGPRDARELWPKHYARRTENHPPPPHFPLGSKSPVSAALGIEIGRSRR
jgi:hypothetical protein